MNNILSLIFTFMNKLNKAAKTNDQIFSLRI